MIQPGACSAAVLAGGYSSRMGRDKAALPFGGVTMLEHQVQKLRALGIADIMISGSQIAVPDTRFVPDVYPHCGPLSGIHACLQAAKHDAVLFLPVDVPLVPAEALQSLLDAHTGGVTLLHHEDQSEPLIAVYDCDLLSQCTAILHTDHFSVRDLLKQAPTHMIPYAGGERWLSNCNTPEEYIEALRRSL